MSNTPSPSQQDRLKKTAQHGAPPRLQFYLLNRLKFLAMINIIPIITGVILAWNYYQGNINFSFTDSQGYAAFLALASCFVIGISWWVIIPCGKWLRNYPRWYYRHQSKIMWWLPYMCGSILWAILWLICMAALIVACMGVLTLVYTLSSDVT